MATVIEAQGALRWKRPEIGYSANQVYSQGRDYAIIRGHHVLALQRPLEGWQATSLLKRCREYAGCRWPRRAVARAVPARDQRHSGVGAAAVDRGSGGWRDATADAVAVSRKPLRGAAGGCVDRSRQAVGAAAQPAAAVGGVLAGADAVAGAAAGCVLVRAFWA